VSTLGAIMVLSGLVLMYFIWNEKLRQPIIQKQAQSQAG